MHYFCVFVQFPLIPDNHQSPNEWQRTFEEELDDLEALNGSSTRSTGLIGSQTSWDAIWSGLRQLHDQGVRLQEGWRQNLQLAGQVLHLSRAFSKTPSPPPASSSALEPLAPVVHEKRLYADVLKNQGETRLAPESFPKFDPSQAMADVSAQVPLHVSRDPRLQKRKSHEMQSVAAVTLKKKPEDAKSVEMEEVWGPKEFATITLIQAGYGVLLMHIGDVQVVFDQHSLLDGGSLEIPDLSDVFRLGDVLSVDVCASVSVHVGHAIWTCKHLKFAATHLAWVRSGDFSRHVPIQVEHGVLLSREPELVFGVKNYRHVDANSSVLKQMSDPMNLAICRTAIIRYQKDEGAGHGYRAHAVTPLTTSWHQNLLFLVRSGANMFAVDEHGPIWVPSHALRYRGIHAADELSGEAFSALTAPILPYENPGPNLDLDLPAPTERAYLIFLPEPE